jgi:hypothetical protein
LRRAPPGICAAQALFLRAGGWRSSPTHNAASARHGEALSHRRDIQERVRINARHGAGGSLAQMTHSTLGSTARARAGPGPGRPCAARGCLRTDGGAAGGEGWRRGGDRGEGRSAGTAAPGRGRRGGRRAWQMPGLAEAPPVTRRRAGGTGKPARTARRRMDRHRASTAARTSAAAGHAAAPPPPSSVTAPSAPHSARAGQMVKWSSGAPG